MNKACETRIEINLEALKHNFLVIKEQLKPQTKIMGVVKAFGYGSDAIVVSKRFQELGGDYLAVAFAEEAVPLRNNGIDLPILVFYPQDKDLDLLIKHKLIPSVYNSFFLDKLVNALKYFKIKEFPIHLKINTGMNRVGFNVDEVHQIFDVINNSKYLKLEGLFSHLAAAGNPNEKAFTLQQIATFNTTIKSLELENKVLKHIANTSGALSYPKAEMDLVRTGIALYGYGNHKDEHSRLIPILALKTPITQTRWLDKGQTLGYDRKFVAQKKTHVAVVFMGYADGIARIYGNGNGIVKINNQKCPIIGNVCMDAFMIDITKIKCKEGDEVTIFDHNHTAIDFDVNALSIPYELITSLSRRIKRVFIDEN